MALPSYTVYINFGAGSSVDVTSYVNSVSITRGGSRVFDDVQAGSITISFNNLDRTFDPFNTSSILWDSTNGYSKVQPNAKVRVFVNGGYIIFTGWVTTWSFTNDEKGLNPQASLTANDGLGILGNATFNPALVTANNTATFANPRIAAATAAWGGTTISLTYYSGKTPLTADLFSPSTTVLSYLQNVARTEPFNFFGTTDGNAKITDRTLTTGVYTLGTPIFNYHRTAGWYNGTATDMSNWYYGGTVPGWGGSVVTNAQFPGEYLLASSNTNGGGVDLFDYFENDATKYKSNQAYSLSFWTNITDGAAYLNLKYVYTNTSGTSSAKVSGSTFFTFPNGGWNQVKIENVTTSLAVNALEFYCIVNGGNTPYLIKDLMITPASTVPAVYFDGERYQQATDYLNDQMIVATGWTGTERLGNSVYLTKTATGGTATLPNYEVFGDAYGTAVVGTAIPISDLQVAYTTDQFYNQASVVRASGGTAVKNNSVSQNLYGIRSYSQSDSLSISPARSTAFANEVIGQYGVPDYVLTDLDVQLEALTSAYQNRVLTLELFDIVRVIYRPYGGGSNIDRTYQIIGIQHNVGLESHVVSFGLASLNSGLFLGSSYLGVLDTQKVV
jgi:hypothetical protein